MLYHVSQITGLKTLRPNVSTHQKPYVYAVENMVTGLLFGAKQDDFDFIITTDDRLKPVVYECYPDAFSRIYQGKGCSVYAVHDSGFRRGMTSWEPELVCDHEVNVEQEIVIRDLYEKLMEEERAGNLEIHRYEYTDAYRKIISSHIVDRLIRFDIDLNNCAKTDKRFSEYYGQIIEALSSVMDGHLLR